MPKLKIRTVFSTILLGVVLALGFMLLERRPKFSGLDFVYRRLPERADGVLDGARFLAVIGALLPCFAHILQPVKGHGFHAHGMRLAFGYALFFLHGFFYPALFLLPLKRRVDALGDLCLL